MSLEEEIQAAGRRVRDLAYEGALKLRQSKLVQELEKIEEELAQIASRKVGVKPAAEEEAVSAPKKAEPKKAEPKTKSQAAKSTSAKS